MADTSNEKPETADAPSVQSLPSEVKIRTMRTDIDLMTGSGGSAPQFRTITVPSPSIAAEETEEKEDDFEKRAQQKKVTPLVIMVAIAVITVLAAVAYLAYDIFFSNGGNISGTSAPAATQGNNQAQQYVAQRLAGTSFTHTTLFSKPVDETLVLALDSTAQSASELQTLSQRFLGIFSGARATSVFFEIDAKRADGSDADINDIFSIADIAILDLQYILAHFSPDATVFAYKDASGIWPGYVLKLKPTENWLFLKDDVAKTEQMGGKIDNFFLTAHGVPDAGGFKDSTIDSSPFRALAFSQPGATFIYGWVRGYLIFSTSVDGLKQALSRL